MTDKSAKIISSQEYRENYDTVVRKIAEEAVTCAFAVFENIVDDKGKKVTFNYEDICNLISQFAQARRQAYVKQSQQE